MKRVAIIVLLLASMASAAYLRILAEYAVNGTLTTTDSIRVNLYYGGTQYNYLTTNKSSLDTVVAVDTTGVYSYWARYYLSGAEKLRDFRNAQAMSGVDFVTGTQIDSVLNAIEDANKANFKATGFATSTQGDSITGAITDANKANFKATGFATSAQGDSLTNAITDANKANFKATGFSTFNPASDSVTLDRTNTLLYTGNFNTAYSTFNVATDSVTIDRTNTLLYVGNFNTAYSTLTASDNIGINWNDITNPTATQNLSGTTISTSQAVASVSGAVGSVTGNVGGNVTGSVGSVTGAVGSVTGNVGGNVTGSVGSVASGGITAASIADGAIDSATYALTAKTAWGHYIWASQARTLTAIDEDNTTLDLNATAIGSVTGAVGSVTGKVTLVDSSANDIAMMGNYHVLDSTWQKEMHDSLDTQGWAATGSSTGLDSATTSRIIKRTVWGIASGTGSDSTTKAQRIIGASPAGDTINAHAPHGNNWASVGLGGDTTGIANNVWNHGTRTLTSGAATADIYPLLERKTTVDAVGATANLLFVVDTTALGTSSETTLLEKAVTIRDADDGKWIKATTIARANCVADNCTLQVAAALPWDVEAGDSVWFWGDRTVPDYPTSAALAAEIRDTVLSTDTTGYRSDATMGGMIVAGGTTAGGSDTTAIKSMLTNNQVLEAADSTVAMANTSLGKGAPRRGEIADTASVSRSVWDNDVIAKSSRTVGVVDSTGKLGEEVLSSLPDSVTQAVMEIQDSVQTQAWASAGVASLPDSVTSAVMEIQDSVQSQSWAATGSGLGTGANSVTYIVRDTTNDVRVSNAMVTIKDTLESTVSAGPTSTGINGYVTVNLDDGTYVALVTANNVTFSTDTFVVSGATTDSIMGYGQMIATAPSSAYCSVYGTLTGAGYEDGGSEDVASRWYVRFTLEEAKSNLSDTSATKVVVIKTVDASTDANGYFNVFLLKTGNLLYKSGSAYKQPIWRMVASPVDVKNDPRIDITFSIPSDSTTLNIGGIISAE